MKRREIPEHHKKQLESLSLALREYRFGEGKTQHELSHQLYIHKNTLQRAENAKNITLLTLFELADAFEISPTELFYDIQ